MAVRAVLNRGCDVHLDFENTRNLYTESSQERIKGLSSLGEVWYALMPTLINKGAFYSF